MATGIYPNKTSIATVLFLGTYNRQTKSKVLLNRLSFLSQYVRKITKGLMKILQINYNIQKLLISFIYFILAVENTF